MYYTVEHPDGANTCFDQCVATSPSLEPGSWTDHGSMNIPVPDLELSSDGSSRPPYVRLDGNLLVDSPDPQGISDVKCMVFGRLRHKSAIIRLYQSNLFQGLTNLVSTGLLSRMIFCSRSLDPRPF